MTEPYEKLLTTLREGSLEEQQQLTEYIGLVVQLNHDLWADELEEFCGLLDEILETEAGQRFLAFLLAEPDMQSFAERFEHDTRRE